ncbi:MAG: serine hydrolase [Hyphomicrobiaceae bacterium]
MVRGIVGVLLRLFAQLAIVLVGFSAFLQSAAPAQARPARHSAMILDANTGAVLHNDDGDERRHPASLTKMMTLYLTFETIEQGRMSMSSKVKISEEAANASPSKLDLDPGEEITVREAILALITKSANDVAVALAEKIGGSERNFARLMNAKARELGMSRTNFENASGLPDQDQVTTARDMITLGLHLQDDYPQYYRLFSTRSFAFRGRSYRNHNTLMNSYGGIDGIKTGYTRDSGFNLVTSVHRNGRHLVGAVFGGASAATRNGEMRVLLTRAMSRASKVKTRKPAPLLVAQLKSPPKPAVRPARPQPDVAVEPPRPTQQAQPKSIAQAPSRPAARPETVVAQAEPQGPSEPAPVTSKDIEPPPGEAKTATPEIPIEMVGKVRRIMVAPRHAFKKPRTNTAETTDMEAREPDEGLRNSAVVASNDFSGLPNVTETIVPKTTRGTGRPYMAGSIPETRVAMIGNSDVPPPMQQTSAAASAEQSDQQATIQPASVQQTTPSVTARTDVAPMETNAPEARAAVALASAPAATPEPTPAIVRPSARPKLLTASLTPPFEPAAQSATFSSEQANRIMRGKRPSTLQAQATAIAEGRPLRGASIDPATSRFEIQIGAYASIGDAQRALSVVQARAGTVVANYPSVTQPVDKGGRTIYRARFRGFDANSAANTCVALRKQSFDCFVMTSY